MFMQTQFKLNSIFENNTHDHNVQSIVGLSLQKISTTLFDLSIKFYADDHERVMDALSSFASNAVPLVIDQDAQNERLLCGLLITTPDYRHLIDNFHTSGLINYDQWETIQNYGDDINLAFNIRKTRTFH